MQEHLPLHFAFVPVFLGAGAESEVWAQPLPSLEGEGSKMWKKPNWRKGMVWNGVLSPERCVSFPK